MKLVVQDLSHTFSNHRAHPALQDVQLEIESGQFVAIIGPSGCGKSTLLRLIANLISPSNGTITLDGLSPGEMIADRQIAWMAQNPALLPWLTARANVELAARFRHQNAHKQLTAEEALRLVGLSDDLNTYPSALSGGMQQRLALARTLMMDAKIWLMDEPFAALDALTRERLTHELAAIWQPLRPTVLWVTHNIHEALLLADRVLIFSDTPGRLIADLPVLMQRPRRESDSAFQSLLENIHHCLASGMVETPVA
jgi:ABC-type nitrate/sulfonate/bicarbonate transport system ATPase subunit